MLGNLYFLNKEDEKILIQENVTLDSVGKKQIEYLTEHGYERPPYWRMWGDSNTYMMYDFGSWSEFFRWEANP